MVIFRWAFLVSLSLIPHPVRSFFFISAIYRRQISPEPFLPSVRHFRKDRVTPSWVLPCSRSPVWRVRYFLNSRLWLTTLKCEHCLLGARWYTVVLITDSAYADDLVYWCSFLLVVRSCFTGHLVTALGHLAPLTYIVTKFAFINFLCHHSSNHVIYIRFLV